MNNHIPINLLEQSLGNILNIHKLPSEINISTMTFICKFNVIFNCLNIANYVDLCKNSILSISSGKNVYSRSIVFKKPNMKKNTIKIKKTFFNQVSLQVYVKSKITPVNVKIFSNGSIQMTGCKQIINIVDALHNVFNEFKKIKAIIDNKSMKIIEKPFASDLSMEYMNTVKDLKIVMINSNFKLDFKIDRNKLFKLLINDNQECFYDPVKHSCVNIKHEQFDKTVSIFVFESGAIVITGATNCRQIHGSYMFINKYIYKHYVQIIKNEHNIVIKNN